MIWGVLFWLSFSAVAEDVAAPGSALSELSEAQASSNDYRSFKTYHYLTCVQENAKSQGLFFNATAASGMIKALSPALDRSFQRHNMTQSEIALFLSQALPESHFLTQLTETADLRPSGDASSTPDQVAMAQMASSASVDHKDLETSKTAGRNIGVGIIQITGMDNQISAIHYVIEKLALGKKEPKWKFAWNFKAPDGVVNPKTRKMGLKDKQVMPDTSDPKTLIQFRNWYRGKYPGSDIAAYDLFARPELMSTPGLVIEDKSDMKLPPMNSSDLMAELSMAYWHGRCQGQMGKIANSKSAKSKSYGPESFESREEYLVASATSCVKGKNRYTREQLETRLKWYRVSKQCVK